MTLIFHLEILSPQNHVENSLFTLSHINHINISWKWNYLHFPPPLLGGSRLHFAPFFSQFIGRS